MSAGFDAAVSDEHLPVGGYRVTPEGYAALTRTLLRATDGKVRLCPSGGNHYMGHPGCLGNWYLKILLSIMTA